MRGPSIVLLGAAALTSACSCADRACRTDDDCASADPCTIGATCERGECSGGAPAPAQCGDAECGADTCGNSCGTCEGPGEVCTAEDQCEPGLTIIRGFVCADTQPAEVVLSSVPGTGATLVARPEGGHCDNRLYLRAADGTELPLSSDVAGYGTAVGRAFPSGHELICVSTLVHHLHPEAATDPSLPRVHVTDRVELRCAGYDGTAWTELTPVVVPDGDWAAWTRGAIAEIATDPPTFTVPYARDFTFQALNLTNRGRPATDGTWSVTVALRDGVVVVEQAPRQVSTAVVDPEWMAGDQWTPTPEERAEYSDVIDFSDGDCPPPGGCPDP